MNSQSPLREFICIKTGGNEIDDRKILVRMRTLRQLLEAGPDNSSQAITSTFASLEGDVANNFPPALMVRSASRFTTVYTDHAHFGRHHDQHPVLHSQLDLET
jgi:hypothetical protein